MLEDKILTESNLIKALNELGKSEAILYVSLSLSCVAHVLADSLSPTIKIIPIAKKMEDDEEWYLVNENGTYYPTIIKK